MENQKYEIRLINDCEMVVDERAIEAHDANEALIKYLADDINIVCDGDTIKIKEVD